MGQEYFIRVENLSKTYGTGENAVGALRDVSFDMRQGECVAVIGKSGSGKSTLLNVLGTLDKADSGKVWVDGEDALSYPPEQQAKFRRRKIGFVYQSYQLVSILNVRENIAMPVRLDGAHVDKRYFEELAGRLGIMDLLERMPDQLSGGQRQRVAIARAMMAKPALVLADEPTGNLDSENAKEVMELLRECQKAFGQTILLVTHDLELAGQADRVLAMQDGRLKS